MGPVLWNVLAFIQRHFRVYCKLAFPALMSWIQQSLYLYSSIEAFPLMEVFPPILYKEVLRMSEVPWNFAYEKHASYSLLAIASQPSQILKCPWDTTALLALACGLGALLSYTEWWASAMTYWTSVCTVNDPQVIHTSVKVWAPVNETTAGGRTRWESRTQGTERKKR